MKDNLIYQSIAERTGGDIYIGVVGPVRTGKSTLIHKILDEVIIPNIENEHDRERTVDQMPQSGSGRTVTTTEPKFIPSDAVGIRVGDVRLSVKMIDSVGFMVADALGATEDGGDRMVMTPWCENPLPFCEASEIGTQRVLREHSTVALLVTCDGSVCDIPRENYIDAEERTVAELKASKKPFAIVLNSKNPESSEALELAHSLEEKYSSPVALVNCSLLNREDIEAILSLVLDEFPLREIKIRIPEWFSLLPSDNALSGRIRDTVSEVAKSVRRLSDIKRFGEHGGCVRTVACHAGTGSLELEIPTSREEFFGAMTDTFGIEIGSDRELFSIMSSLCEAKREYDKIKDALTEAKESGYGVVLPAADELTVSAPSATKSSGGWGVCLNASGGAIHIITTEVSARICPVIGSEEQSEQVVRMLMDEYEENPRSILTARMLGRSILDLVNDGIQSKITHLTGESRRKLASALGRIVNEGADGLICILV